MTETRETYKDRVAQAVGREISDHEALQAAVAEIERLQGELAEARAAHEGAVLTIEKLGGELAHARDCAREWKFAARWHKARFKMQAGIYEKKLAAAREALAAALGAA